MVRIGDIAEHRVVLSKVSGTHYLILGRTEDGDVRLLGIVDESPFFVSENNQDFMEVPFKLSLERSRE